MEQADTALWATAGLSIFGFLLTMAAVALMFRKAGPHEALVVYGFRKDIRIRIARGTVVFPIVETCKVLSLETMVLGVSPRNLYTKEGVVVTVGANALVRVKRDPESIVTAASQLLTKSPEERADLVRLVIAEHLRGIVRRAAAEQIVKDPQVLAEQMRSTAAVDLDKMGIEMISFTLKGRGEGEQGNTGSMSESGVTAHQRDRAATASGQETAGDK